MDKETALKNLPSIDRLMDSPQLSNLSKEYPRIVVLNAARSTVESLRKKIRLQSAPPLSDKALSIDEIIVQVVELAQKKMEPSLREVINATGTILHTNLGRAPLCQSALKAVERTAQGYSNLEYDLETGNRGERFSHLEELLCHLTGAERAAVVNNNAGAVLLALTALAKGKEAIVSRGELVEIGGAFRIPDVMETGGVGLREVGTTNRTHLKDYQEAIGERTGLLLKVHTSNYRILGFTKQVTSEELVNLGEQNGLPVMEDLGSGLLFDLSHLGLPKEPTVKEKIKEGLDVVSFSGDKLLGGPQAGILVGKARIIERIRKHPLSRALRSDKLTLAALEATLMHYLEKEDALQKIPTLQMLNESCETTRERCESLIKDLQSVAITSASLEIVPMEAQVGGGALPLAELPGFAIALTPKGGSAEKLSRRLRLGSPPVICRIKEGRLLLNPKTILPGQEKPLLHSLEKALCECRDS